MLETRKHHFTHEELDGDLDALLVELRRSAVGAVLATEDETGFTLWWREEPLPIDPLQDWV